jgi:hypothetical protein
MVGFFPQLRRGTGPTTHGAFLAVCGGSDTIHAYQPGIFLLFAERSLAGPSSAADPHSDGLYFATIVI